MKKLIGIAEILVLIGLICIGFGLWMTIGYWSLVAVGIIVTSLGLFLAGKGI